MFSRRLSEVRVLITFEKIYLRCVHKIMLRRRRTIENTRIQQQRCSLVLNVRLIDYMYKSPKNGLWWWEAKNV